MWAALLMKCPPEIQQTPRTRQAQLQHPEFSDFVACFHKIPYKHISPILSDSFFFPVTQKHLSFESTLSFPSYEFHPWVLQVQFFTYLCFPVIAKTIQTPPAATQEGCHLLPALVCRYIAVSVIRRTQQGMALRLSVPPPNTLQQRNRARKNGTMV